MRKLKLQVQMSIDGFVAGPKGEMDWMTWDWDDDLKKYVTQLTEAVDCIVLGRKLAQGFIPHWAANPQMEGADIFNNTRKVVFTKTLDASKPEVKNWANTTLARGDLADEISELKRQPGGDLITYGGAELVSSLLTYNLIDDIHLFINPVAVGNGLTIFSDIPANQHFRLVGSHAFDCGIVVLNYHLKGDV